MLIGMGVALAVVAVCCFVQSRLARQRSAFLAAAHLLTCAEVASAEPGQVAVTAETGAQPRLCAPVSGRNCVWYRVAVSLHMRDEGLGPVKRRHETVAGCIYLVDATGKVPLTRELAAQPLTQRGDSPIITTTGFPNSSAAHGYVTDLWRNCVIGPQHSLAEPGPTRLTYQLTEEILPVAAPVLVVGTIQADGAGGQFLDRASRHDGATTLSQREAVGYLAARARHRLAWALSLAAIGLAAVIAGILLIS